MNVQNAIGDLYARTNCLSAQFQHAHFETRIQLFASFCLHMYGSELWSVTNEPTVIQSFMVALRKCIRHILKLPPMTHSNLLPALTGIQPANLMILNRCHSLMKLCHQSDNLLVSICLENAINGSRSNVSTSIARLAEINSCRKSDLLLPRCVALAGKIEPEVKAVSEGIKELLVMLQERRYEESDVFSSREIVVSFLNYLCVN